MQHYIQSAQLTLFLFGVFLISFSGAMMPGPVTAAVIAKGQKSSYAGILAAVGHGVVEIPLIILIAFGLSALFQNPLWKTIIGVVGGGVLVWMGFGMIKERAELGEGRKDIPYGSLRAGAITTASNPYFYLWWATVGAQLITKSLLWSVVGVALFAVVHTLVDFIWYWFLSFASYHGKRVMSPKAHIAIFAICGILLASFGLYFFIDGSGLLRLLGEKFA